MKLPQGFLIERSGSSFYWPIEVDFQPGLWYNFLTPGKVKKKGGSLTMVTTNSDQHRIGASRSYDILQQVMHLVNQLPAEEELEDLEARLQEKRVDTLSTLLRHLKPRLKYVDRPWRGPNGEFRGIVVAAAPTVLGSRLHLLLDRTGHLSVVEIAQHTGAPGPTRLVFPNPNCILANARESINLGMVTPKSFRGLVQELAQIFLEAGRKAEERRQEIQNEEDLLNGILALLGEDKVY